MRSGLESTSGGNYGPWVRSRNWVRYALDRPMVSEPGTSMEYSTGTSHILSAILTKATRKSTLQYANEVLGKALGFQFATWTRDPQGIFFGGNEMSMTPRQIVAELDKHVIGQAQAQTQERPQLGGVVDDDYVSMVLGLDPAVSDSNFVFFGGLADSHAVWQGLLERGVLVRDVGIPHHLRVTAGTETETTAFLAALREVLAETPAATPGQQTAR